MLLKECKILVILGMIYLPNIWAPSLPSLFYDNDDNDYPRLDAKKTWGKESADSFQMFRKMPQADHGWPIACWALSLVMMMVTMTIPMIMMVMMNDLEDASGWLRMTHGLFSSLFDDGDDNDDSDEKDDDDS